MDGKNDLGLVEERVSALVDITYAEEVFEYINGTIAALMHYGS